MFGSLRARRPLFVLTCKDVEILGWIGRVGAAGVEHVMRRFEMSRSHVYQRLRGLVRAGLLEWQAVLYRQRGLYLATSEGLRMCGLSRLRTYRLSPSGFVHAGEVAAAAAVLGVGLDGWRLLAEREIRMLEADRGAPAFSAVVGSLPGDRPVLHRPDLAAVSPEGRVIAVEVELSVKAPRRLATICRGWARARGIDAVYYLASSDAARAVARAVAETYAEDRIEVLSVEAVETLVEIETTMTATATTATTGQMA
jgi:hypothetical protein